MVVEPCAAVAERLTLVSGPANSGKSLWAETLAQRSGCPVLYVATGPQRPDDKSWQERLQRHRRRRPPHWRTQEVGLALVEAIETAPPQSVVLVDSLGTWVAAGLELDALSWLARCDALLMALQCASARFILVSEETGWGVVPATQVGGLFRERLGALMQQLMPICDNAWVVLHGRAINLLACSEPVPSAREASP